MILISGVMIVRHSMAKAGRISPSANSSFFVFRFISSPSVSKGRVETISVSPGPGQHVPVRFPAGLQPSVTGMAALNLLVQIRHRFL